MPDESFAARRRKRRLKRDIQRNDAQMTRRLSEEARLVRVAQASANRAAAKGSRFVFRDDFVGPLPSGAQRASAVASQIVARQKRKRKKNAR